MERVVAIRVVVTARGGGEPSGGSDGGEIGGDPTMVVRRRGDIRTKL